MLLMYANPSRLQPVTGSSPGYRAACRPGGIYREEPDTGAAG